MVSKKSTCPYCGYEKFHRTLLGWTETSINGTASLAVAFGVGIISEHNGHHLGTEMMEGNSSEYKCDKCEKHSGIQIKEEHTNDIFLK